MSIENLQLACRFLKRLGAWLGWGLPMMGLLASVQRVIPMFSNGFHRANPVDPVSTLLGVAQLLLGYGLAGGATHAVFRLLAASVEAHFEWSVVDGQSRLKQLELIVAALERLRTMLEPRPSPEPTEIVAVSRDGRSQLLTRIQGAIRSTLLVEAAAMIGEFAAKYPDDPILEELEEQIAEIRLKARREQMAQLEAAREVNDPDRVLEIYLGLAASLEVEGRNALERDLAKWFLTLIHRRLRTGSIRADVVQLASQFAEAFAATVEGASVRAALPTLRRSVGLCPRCAQPYVGLDEACPNCLKAGAN